MRVVGFLRFLPVLLSAFVLSGCSDSYEWKQKITVTVETPQGEVSGSSVQSVQYKKFRKPVLAEGNSSSWKVDGEAVVVALPVGGYLFGLLKGETTYGDVHHVLQSVVYPTIGPRTNEALARAAEQPLGSHFRVEGRNRPMLVTFKDIRDPKSVQEVKPDDLAAAFGEGYALKSITLEVTDERVTMGKTESLLEWLGWSREKLLSVGGGRNPVCIRGADPRYCNALSKSDFRTGKVKDADF